MRVSFATKLTFCLFYIKLTQYYAIKYFQIISNFPQLTINFLIIYDTNFTTN